MSCWDKTLPSSTGLIYASAQGQESKDDDQVGLGKGEQGCNQGFFHNSMFMQ